MYVVCFNGPPECGKDTLSQMLVEHTDKLVTLSVLEDSLSIPLRHLAYKMVGMNYIESGPVPDDYMIYSAFKSAWFGQFQATGRQLMIDVSESFLKPVYGKTIMAKMLIEKHGDFDGLLLIRDCGFQLEVDPLIQAYGEENVLVCRIWRDGKDFTHDSRERVYHPLDSHNMAVSNNGTLDDLSAEAANVYLYMARVLNWKL